MFEVRRFRIHGDNIVECHRTLSIIAEAYGVEPVLTDSPVFAPVYALAAGKTFYYYQLLSGHDRWGGDLREILMANGAVLREGADSYLTEIVSGREKILLGIEYCSALPAGNNAWQRNGRAFACVMAGIPYLYYAEIGGVELDEDREPKASRFPNPIVPFSYLSLAEMSGALCMPVYRPHPSITQELYSVFSDVFGYKISLGLIYKLIERVSYTDEADALKAKTLMLVNLLSDTRRSIDTFRGDEWIRFLQPSQKINTAEDSPLDWKKKVSSKVNATRTFRAFLDGAREMPCKTVGAKEIPLCLVPVGRLVDFESILNRIYPDLPIEFDRDRPLVVAWITGFKPGGDDSRPDRGLIPLARMLMGNQAAVMAVVYGPGSRNIWDNLSESLALAAEKNGLFEAIVNLCDHLLVDSPTNPGGPQYYRIMPRTTSSGTDIVFDALPGTPVAYSEHDTDTAIRQLLSHNTLPVKECMCNPPGGDWSGISYFTPDVEYRWTSLPRVSGSQRKRPDHVFQFDLEDGPLFIAIESKEKARNLETLIGDRLRLYIDDLFSVTPTCSLTERGEWRSFTGSLREPDYRVLTVGAFKYGGEDELYSSLIRGHLDAVIAFEFGEKTVLHVIYDNPEAEIISDFFRNSLVGNTRLEIQIHTFGN